MIRFAFPIFGILMPLMILPAFTGDSAAAEGTDVSSTDGTFVWHDLITADEDQAIEFYTKLFGWTSKTDDMEGLPFPYTTFSKGGAEVAGLVAMELPEGVPPHWNGYLGVKDLDASLEYVTSNGGKMNSGPLEIEGLGRFASVADPQGAALSLFQFDPQAQESGMSDGPGSFCWNELMTSDVDSGRKFLTGLTGWTNEIWDLGELGHYTIFEKGDEMICGMMAIPEGEQIPPCWCYYVQVDDVDGTFARAQELGATPQMPPTDIPDVGRFAVIFDPQGAHLAIFRALEGGRVSGK